MDAIASAQTSLTLAVEVISAYLQSREVADEAAITIEPLQDLLCDPVFANACHNNPPRAVTDALCSVEAATQAITDRANEIKSKARWLQILFATKYSTKLLRLVAGLHARLSELHVLLTMGANGMQQQLNEIRRQHHEIEQRYMEATERFVRMDGRAASVSSAGVREQLHEALGDAVDKGDTAEALTIERVLAFLDGTPSDIDPAEVTEMLFSLQRQIDEAQADRSQAEAVLLEQFANYLAMQGEPGGLQAVGPSAGWCEELTANLTCAICQKIFDDPVRYAQLSCTQAASTYAHRDSCTHTQIHTPQMHACVHARICLSMYAYLLHCLVCSPLQFLLAYTVQAWQHPAQRSPSNILSVLVLSYMGCYLCCHAGAIGQHRPHILPRVHH